MNRPLHHVSKSIQTTKGTLKALPLFGGEFSDENPPPKDNYALVRIICTTPGCGYSIKGTLAGMMSKNNPGCPKCTPRAEEPPPPKAPPPKRATSEEVQAAREASALEKMKLLGVFLVGSWQNANKVNTFECAAAAHRWEELGGEQTIHARGCPVCKPRRSLYIRNNHLKILRE